MMPNLANREQVAGNRYSREAGNPLRLTLLLLAVFLAAQWAFGQAVITGIPPFSSMAPSNFDQVNEANLNVFFSIPVMTKAGQGMPFSYTLTYNSAVWSKWNSIGNLAWTPAGGWGWGAATAASTGFMEYTVTQGECYHQKYYYWNIYYFTNYYDPQGTPHPYDHTVSSWSSSYPCGSGAANNYTATINDGSGYTITVYASPAAYVYTRSGLEYTIPLQYQTGNGNIYDTNGNSITISLSGTTTTFTDTLGATALTANGAAYTYTGPNGTPETVSVSYASHTVQTNFGCSGITEYGPTQQNLVNTVTMPDGSVYTFGYETTPGYPGSVTGRLAMVGLPTGGTISYSYSGGSNGITCQDGSTATLTRTTSNGGGPWVYAHTEGTSTSATTITDPNSNQTVITFEGAYAYGNSYEVQRQVYQGSQASGTLMETVNTCYNGDSIPCVGTAFNLPITSRSVQTTLPGLSPAQTTTDYNTPYGMLTETDEYTYGPALVRKTVITYEPTIDGYIQDRPQEIQIFDSGETLRAQTQYSYDGKGNLKTETRSTGGTPPTISRTFGYTSNGVLSSRSDFNGNTTTYGSFTCGANNTAFPQTITMPNSLSRSFSWNCYVGLPNSVKDFNGHSTSFTFDSMVRLTNIGYPDGGSSSITFTSPTVYNLYTALTGSTSRHDQLDLDGLGRVTTSSMMNDPDGETYVATSYDSVGRLASVSNPYRGSSSGGDTYTYDALNRVTKVTHADSNYATTTYGSGTAQSCSSSTYGYGYSTVYTDESGKQRQKFTDALGRMIEVDEPNSSGGLTVNTCYSYDALGDLTGVVQGSQTRTYGYDMLSRVTQTITPESGTTTYSYTASGGTPCSGNPSAVCSRTDAHGTATTYSYDTLNRLLTKSYSDGTPTAYFTYDEQPWGGLLNLNNTAGRLSHAWTSAGSGYVNSIYSYDPVGRVADYWQCTPYNCGGAGGAGAAPWDLHYNYDLGGDVTSWTRPANFTITNTVSTAQRITEITSSLSDSTHPPILAQNMTYTPWGALSGLQNGCVGTGCIQTQETYTYNNRLQPWMIQLGDSTSSFDKYCLVYNYYTSWTAPTSCPSPGSVPTSGPGNNGNAMGYWYQDNVYPSLSHTAANTYDSVNRLTSSVATGNSTYNLTFSYDQYGNMTCVLNGNTQGYCPQYSYGNSPQNNEITNSGFGYDAAGDLTGDGTNTYQYDAEQHPVSVNNGSAASYTYNPLGLRVQSLWPGVSSNPVSFLYDPNGTWVGNNQAGTWSSSAVYLGSRPLAFDGGAPAQFLHVNALNSTTMETSYSGGVSSDVLFYPWGDMWKNPVQRDYQFAGTIWMDGVSSTDFAAYRLYRYDQGRWLTPDPLGGDVTNPQSLNRYAYVLNNPTTLTDPLGLQSGCPFGAHSIGPGQCEDDIPGGGLHWPVNWMMDEFSLLQISVRLGTVMVQGEYGFYEVGGPTAGLVFGSDGGGCSGRDPGNQQQTINKQLRSLFTNLIDDSQCMAWLRSHGKDPIVEATLAHFTAKSMPPGYGAWVTDAGNVEINSSGGFFTSHAAGGGTLYAGGIFLGGTTQAQQFVLLHEIAHLTNGIVPERGSDVQEDANNLEILKHCQQALGIK